MHSFLAILLFLFVPAQAGVKGVGTLPRINPIYAPVTVEHGDLTISSDQDLAAEPIVAGEVELSDEWKWRGVNHKVRTVKRSSESDEAHAKRHQRAVLVNLEMFPPDPPVTQG